MPDLKIECAKCSACCREMIVVLTHHDVNRITEATGLAAQSFVTMYSPREIALEPDHKGWVKMPSCKRVMGLKQKQGRCVFLSRNNGCTIYNARPVACRTYPLDIELCRNNRITAIGFQERAAYNGKTCTAVARIAAKDNCIIEYTMQEDREDRSYWRKCSQWNRLSNGERTAGKFLAFLGL